MLQQCHSLTVPHDSSSCCLFHAQSIHRLVFCYIKISVVPSCAYPGFSGILLCGFPCLLSICMLVMSGSPCEPILMVLLIYDSINHILVIINIYITQIWVYHLDGNLIQHYCQVMTTGCLNVFNAS